MVVVLVEFIIVLINKFWMIFKLNSQVVVKLVRFVVINIFMVVSDRVGYNVIWKEDVWVCMLLFNRMMVNVRLLIRYVIG